MLMDVLAWILSGLLAAAFAGAGLTKLATPRDKLVTNPQMAWTEDFSQSQIRGIGAVEVLGALGVVLPWLLDVAPVLSPVAALGLGVVMLGAMITHRRRGELAKTGPVNAALLVVAIVVAVLRFTQL